MRIGSHSVPFRVVLASSSLAMLGLAVALPSIAEKLNGNDIDPMITASIDKVDAGDPTQTQLPAELGAADLEGDAAPAPRQILPVAPATGLANTVEPVDEVEMAAGPSASEMTVVADVDEAETRAEAEPERDPVATVSAMAGAATDAGGIVLALDHARVMRVIGDVATIIIGNPSIADVSMPDPGTIILTGKSYGETNMVMLDSNGDILAEQMLRVTVRGQSLLSVYRGVQRTTLSCSPTCEIRPTPGDSPEAAQAGLNAFQARNQAALEAVRNE